MNPPSRFRSLALTLSAVLGAVVVLTAADNQSAEKPAKAAGKKAAPEVSEKPARAAKDPAGKAGTELPRPVADANGKLTPGTSESSEKPAPLPPPYRVIPAFGTPPGPAVPGDADKRRKEFEDALNKAWAEGYEFAGMNGDWAVLEARVLKSAEASVSPTRRRVVLPTSP